MLPEPTVFFSIRSVRAAMGKIHQAGRTIGFVPTMGALHEGHLSLVRAARATCDYVIVSIFVNPTQFGPHEDLARYPRTWETDVDALAGAGVDGIFSPTTDEMYPHDWTTWVEPPRVATPLEGEFRPGHMRGVATIVLKLFMIVPADRAFFGEKDYQQCLVVRDMVRDLNIPIEIQICPTVREADGLALSSRNAYLTPQERQRGLGLSRAIQDVQRAFAAGERRVHELEAIAQDVLVQAGVDKIDYASIRQVDDLAPLVRIDQSAILLIAARVGSTRLIDNGRLPAPNAENAE